MHSKVDKFIKQKTVYYMENQSNSDLGAVSGSLDTIPLFQYNVAVEGQRQMIEHIQHLNKEIMELKEQLKLKDEIIEYWKNGGKCDINYR